MSKIKCVFDNNIVECKVVENMGYQCGYYVKAVIYNNEEKIVVKKSGFIWGVLELKEKIGIKSNYIGQ